MQAFFQGWRRKCGCVVLAFTCLVACLWFRSDFAYDVAMIPLGADKYLQIASTGRYIALGTLSVTRVGEHSDGKVSRWVSGSARASNGDSVPWMILEIESSSVMTGVNGTREFGLVETRPRLRTGNGGEYHAQFSSRLIPCWSIVLPLTLISAWLLLIKPMQTKHVRHAAVEEL